MRGNVKTLCCAFLVFAACRSVPSAPGEPPPPAPALPSAAAIAAAERAGNLREALARSSGLIAEELASGASIAVISIDSPDNIEGEFAAEELTFLLVQARRFRVVDRHNLDIIRAEQDFQLSGEVDDETAVSIGHLIGTAFVIAGSISRMESARYLRIRVLDVQTGQIQAMTSISYGGGL